MAQIFLNMSNVFVTPGGSGIIEHKKKSRRGRPHTQKMFKIKYTTTDGAVKTRNIKASSEQAAMGKISDIAQHHYTITEDIETGKQLENALEAKETIMTI
jgi:hypothetical protein